jgi:hypothetical protein
MKCGPTVTTLPKRIERENRFSQEDHQERQVSQYPKADRLFVVRSQRGTLQNNMRANRAEL